MRKDQRMLDKKVEKEPENACVKGLRMLERKGERMLKRKIEKEQENSSEKWS